MTLEIQHDAAARRFFTTVDGHTGYLSYVPLDERTLDYRSTYVPVELRGRGVASEIVRHALQYAKDEGLKIVPTCPFVAAVIERDPSFADLVA